MGSVAKIEDTVDQMIASMASGDDGAARVLAAFGSFIVISDAMYRGISITLGVAETINDTADLAGALVGSESVSPIDYFRDVKRAWNNVSESSRLMTAEEWAAGGLYDWELTCMGAGFAMAGLTLYVMSHPEWVDKGIEGAGMISRQAEELAEKLLISAAEGGADAGSITDLASALPAVIGIATAAPGVPPPP